MADFPRLIEHAFPLKQTSLDSVHEKNVRHGHISTLHIWPARRPLAACRAALIATLLPDPSASPKPEGLTDAQWDAEIKRRRQVLCEKIGGKLVRKIEKKKMPNGQVVERVKEETEGGILHWGRETENADDLEWFRQEIRKAYGGRAPKVLDPFSGGGAIPLEAMRLGCEATAVDINPVAWFILKCTLEYPQKLAGQKRPLPEFILDNEDFMASFKKASGYTKGQGKGGKEDKGTLFSAGDEISEADLAWHVRAWGQWVLERARRELATYYPTYAEFEAGGRGGVSPLGEIKSGGDAASTLRLVPLKDDGTPDVGLLNAEFSKDYLENKRNPRWVAKPTVAYLWARTVKCKNCRAEVPLLKTRWLCKTENKRVLLTMESRSGVPPLNGLASGEDAASTIAFGIEEGVLVQGGNAAQRREHDKRIGAGTMSRSGTTCPCCGAINTMEDIRLEGKAGRLGAVMTAVVVDGQNGKEYRRPTEHELKVAAISEERIQAAFKDVPFGVPEEPTPSAEALGMRVPLYGFDKWRKLFTSRQLVALGTFVAASRSAREEMKNSRSGVPPLDNKGGSDVPSLNKITSGGDAASTIPHNNLASGGDAASTIAAGALYPPEWIEAAGALLAVAVDRIADRQSTVCRWDNGYSKLQGTFTRFALPITWDFCEGNPFSDTTGNFGACLEWVAEYVEHGTRCSEKSPSPSVVGGSATKEVTRGIDCVLTDPPYYDAIPYSDLMDFFYIWLRRTLFGVSEEIDRAFKSLCSPKWDDRADDGELIDDSSRHHGDAAKSKAVYENGMARVFQACHTSLTADGRMVIVFAHKHPDAWETLVTAIIRAGFVVDGSWPIQTEMLNRTRAMGCAALSSSVWLVCRKRPETARPGWDNKVLEEMRSNIATKLRDFWDAGIRGPDFIWAATGPALEAYSKHPVVRKADEPDGVMEVSEFLTHVRRMVVDFIVGQVLGGGGSGVPPLNNLPSGGDAASTLGIGSGVSGGDAASTMPDAASTLDPVTAYYLLHRNDFGLDAAPIGACILYATACGLSDSELERNWNLLVRSGSNISPKDDAAESGGDAASTIDLTRRDAASTLDDDDGLSSSGGQQIKLKAWNQRHGKTMGYDAPAGQAVPLIDRIHRLMYLWKAGDLQKVDEYLDSGALRRNELFKRVVQSLIELSEGNERVVLESISNHVGARGAVKDRGAVLFTEENADTR